MKTFLICLLIISFSNSLKSQLTQNKLNELTKTHTKKSFPLLREFLSIPNDAHFREHIENNILWCTKEFANRNFSVKKIETETVPLLLAEWKQKDAKKTVLIYLQVDGQPVDSSKWDQKSPYYPVLKKQNKLGDWEEISWNLIQNYNDNWRIFARSAADAKSPIVMFLAALDAINEIPLKPNYNIKVIMDFEEELGSPNLAKAVVSNYDDLKSDMLVIFDGPLHESNRPTLIFGARGIAMATITTYGPITSQHSGHFGNYAPNPIFRLARILASMKDDDGIVKIPGFYENITIDQETEKILKAVPDDEEKIMERLQIGSVDKVGEYYQKAIQYPSLNIRGFQSGWVDDKARTIVPSQARAEIDVRLVPDSDANSLLKLIEQHIKQQGFYVTPDIPSKEERLAHDKIASFNSKILYQAFRTDFNQDSGIWLRHIINKTFGNDPIMIRMSGGSIPISPFVKALDIPAVAVPTVNYDNNQHGPDENIRLGNYEDGIKTMIAILAEKL